MNSKKNMTKTINDTRNTKIVSKKSSALIPMKSQNYRQHQRATFKRHTIRQDLMCVAVDR